MHERFPTSVLCCESIVKSAQKCQHIAPLSFSELYGVNESSSIQDATKSEEYEGHVSAIVSRDWRQM